MHVLEKTKKSGSGKNENIFLILRADDCVTIFFLVVAHIVAHRLSFTRFLDTIVFSALRCVEISAVCKTRE